MGRILQIRVGAWTYDEDEVLRTWPHITALVWTQLDQWGPVGLPHGVVELATHVADAIRFSDLPKEQKEQLAPLARVVTALLEEMRTALADWKPRAANALSERLEEALTELDGQMAALE